MSVVCIFKNFTTCWNKIVAAAIEQMGSVYVSFKFVNYDTLAQIETWHRQLCQYWYLKLLVWVNACNSELVMPSCIPAYIFTLLLVRLYLNIHYGHFTRLNDLDTNRLSLLDFLILLIFQLKVLECVYSITNSDQNTLKHAAYIKKYSNSSTKLRWFPIWGTRKKSRGVITF